MAATNCSKHSSNGKGSYAAYKAENRALKNKRAKLERHIRQQPNDLQAQSALSSLRGSTYTGRTQPKRKAPKTITIAGTKMGTSTKLALTNTSNRLTSAGRFMQQLIHKIKVTPYPVLKIN